MVLEEEEGGTDFLKFVEEFGLRSMLEDVIDGKGEKDEVEEREGEEKEAEDEDEEDSDDAEDEDGRSINSIIELFHPLVPSVQTDTISSRSSLPMITVFPRFHHLIIPNFRWQTATPSTSTIRISSRYPKILESSPFSNFFQFHASSLK